MTRLFALACAALFAFGLASTEAAAGGYGGGCYGVKHGGCARAWRHAGCGGAAYRPCKRKHGFLRRSPPCVAYAPCAAPVPVPVYVDRLVPVYVERPVPVPVYVERRVPVPVIVDVQPVRPAYYARPCGVYRGCGRW